jgi:hypothetical protein
MISALQQVDMEAVLSRFPVLFNELLSVVARGKDPVASLAAFRTLIVLMHRCGSPPPPAHRWTASVVLTGGDSVNASSRDFAQGPARAGREATRSALLTSYIYWAFDNITSETAAMTLVEGLCMHWMFSMKTKARGVLPHVAPGSVLTVPGAGSCAGRGLDAAAGQRVGTV